MKDQLGNAISASFAVGRDNGVTALRHDTPISVSQVEDEVMAGRPAGRLGSSWRTSRERRGLNARLLRERTTEGRSARAPEQDGENEAR